MRLVFAGTPEFASRALAAISDAGHEVALVLTQPDRRAGRGLKESESAVKRVASDRKLRVLQPETLRSGQVLAEISAVQADALVVAAYGLILPPAVLRCTRLGSWNIHASLLPRWRGAAPIQRALLAGDRQTGVSIMQMDEGLDTGPVLTQQSIAILEDDDAGSLHDRLAELGSTMILAALDILVRGAGQPAPQPDEGATYAAKIAKEETLLAWDRSAHELERAIRAFRPSPGAQARLEGVPVKIWRASVAQGRGAPGTVLRTGADGIVVACGTDCLSITELQRAGGRRLAAADFLHGHHVVAGSRFD